MGIDLACRKVLMSAYLYYLRSESVLTDAENDSMVEFIAQNWAQVPARYLPLIDPQNEGAAALVATTHHCKFTRQVEGGALAWLQREQGITLPPLDDSYFTKLPVSGGFVEDLLG